MFQRFLTYIVVLAMFAMAGLIAAPVIINLDGYKNDFANLVKEATGIKPEITGDAAVSLFPYPNITINGVNLPNVEGTTSASIFSVDSIKANFTFSSLFNGDLNITSVSLLRPKIELERTENGERNWIKIFQNKKRQ